MPDYLLLEAGGKLLLEGGGSLLLESGGAGGTDPYPRHLALRLVRRDVHPAAEFLAGLIRRAPLPPTGAQYGIIPRRTVRDPDPPAPFDGFLRRIVPPPSADVDLPPPRRIIPGDVEPPLFPGAARRRPLPPTGAQYAVLFPRTIRDPDPPLPFNGAMRRAPVPPTGETDLPTYLARRIVPGDVEPPLFPGRARRAPLPPTGQASPGPPIRRVARPLDAEPAPAEGHVRRTPAAPFHTGSDTTPEPVDSLRPRRGTPAEAEPPLFPGSVRRSRIPPTGEDAYGILPYLRRPVGERPHDPHHDPAGIFEGRARRHPASPFATGESSASPPARRIVRPEGLLEPPREEGLYLGLVRRKLPGAGDPAWPGLLAHRIVREPQSDLHTPTPGRVIRRPLFATGLSAATGRLAVGPPFLGGLRFSAMRWLGPHSLQVDFVHSRDDLCVQLYAGRSLIGHTTDPADVRLVAHLVPSAWPQPLQLVAVEPAEVLTDYGSLLPLRAYNRVRLDWTSAGMPGDTRLIEIAAGTAPAGAVDTTNVLDRVRFDRDRAYVWRSRPLAGSGVWNFEIAARDDRPGDGNRGTALALSATVLSAPPDVRLDSSGRRLVVAVAAQTATVTFLEPE